MADSKQEQPCWTLYSPLLSILKTEQGRNDLEEATMASQCGRYPDARAIFDHKLPPSSSIPMLAMQHADILSNQGVEQERLRLLKETLNANIVAQSSEASMERLLLELMLLDASYWAHGRMDGLLDKARRIRECIAQVNVDCLDDIEVS